jgi:hypothetical protein
MPVSLPLPHTQVGGIPQTGVGWLSLVSSTLHPSLPHIKPSCRPFQALLTAFAPPDLLTPAALPHLLRLFPPGR